MALTNMAEVILRLSAVKHKQYNKIQHTKHGVMYNKQGPPDTVVQCSKIRSSEGTHMQKHKENKLVSIHTGMLAEKIYLFQICVTYYCPSYSTQINNDCTSWRFYGSLL